MTGYDEDLAYIHHAGFTKLAEQAAVRIVGLLRDQRIGPGLVVELGCGSGVTARALTEAGYELLGIDSSPAMVGLARRTAPRASFRVGSFVDEPLPQCVGVGRSCTRSRRAGFSARVLRGYAGERFAPGHAVLVGRRRG